MTCLIFKMAKIFRGLLLFGYSKKNRLDQNTDLFDASRKVCDNFEDVVGFGKVFTDVRLLCTNNSDGQARTYMKGRE